MSLRILAVGGFSRRLFGLEPRKLGAGSGAGGAGALPGRRRDRPAPGRRARGPQSRAHRLYFQGPVFPASPHLRRVGVFFFLPQKHTQKHRHRLPPCSPTRSAQSFVYCSQLQIADFTSAVAGLRLAATGQKKCIFRTAVKEAHSRVPTYTAV